MRRLHLENGTLQFADRSLATPFEATIGELSGGLSGLSTAPGDPARLQLTGKVEKYGSVRISGTIDPGAPRTLANIRAQFRNIDLAQLTPYVVKFAGYRVRSGRVSADLRYRVREGTGSVALSPPEEENAAQVAKMLAARPQLGVQVRPSYDPERDSAALRAAAARREIARRAGYETAGPLDFTDPHVLEAAEKLYLARVGNRLELQALRERSPRYGRSLVDALSATVQVPSPDQLARERAQAVREALVEHGVDAARVTVEAPTARSAGKDGIATRLALTAEPGGTGGEASAGAGTRQAARVLHEERQGGFNHAAESDAGP